MQKIYESNRGKVHYWVEGNSENTIVFTHGMTMDHSMFDEQVKYFNKNFKVIVWDVPLHGHSRPYKDFSLKHVTEDLNEILSIENVDKVHLVGQSMGGYITQEFGVLYPGKVETITIVDSNPYGKEYYSNFERSMALKMGKMTKLYPYKSLIKAIAKSSCYTQSARHQALKTLESMTKDEIIFLMDKVYGDMFSREESHHYDVPVQIIYGEYDKTGLVKKYSRMWAEKEDYELVEIKDAGHNSNQDNPKSFNEILEKFIRRVSEFSYDR